MNLGRPPGAHSALSRRQRVMKTTLDYLIAVPTLVLVTPLLIVLALWIRLDSPGPVLHRRRVLGFGGGTFDALKLRTMFVDGDQALAGRTNLQAELRETHKIEEDPRVTRPGRWLRRFSLDELPQLYNVVRGEMSLVGPRMISPPELERFGDRRDLLLSVKPGLTGLWQVSGRSSLSYDDRVRLDALYVTDYTFRTDLRILFVRTLPAVLRGRGAY